MKKIQKVLNRLKVRISESSFYSTRGAYGEALVELGKENQNVVVLDAEVANSTFENEFQKRFPDRFFEMFIAEENMMSVALGLSKIGYIPFLSTFASFLTQTFDQVRMAQYSQVSKSGSGSLNIVGSHSGVSIGADGPSQMGLEDIAMFRSILNSVVFYPADAVSAKKLTKLMAANKGIFYLRLTRNKTPIIYSENERFKMGGSKIFKLKTKNEKLKILIIAAGITVHEALKAQKELIEEGIDALVLDCYSVKPLDEKTIIKLTEEYKNIIVVEDHYPYGGIGEAISSLLVNNLQQRITNFVHLCVRKIPCSGLTEELLRYEEIDSEAIIKSVRKILL
ncbi:MAG: Transketolase [Candidatus Roizmanbacteria bacterium GW2011_GWC2_37_13]|uniref:Transketolase n=1 Tax=Candidatus Roizmanbacteria bacterium GW2011_GWC2_37_13 TaxID=1618486 RepID=A0A0G0GKL2_9BACT|nr:MAG: transketolase, transketolase [Candidatus Roizmanbacteria bacterium GW2011_GWC1_37_12]KKQ26685.1 MAG: Transketolase [Candidatus Roizmanbacteria bacterium GW2011_GWC2_37_13]